MHPVLVVIVVVIIVAVGIYIGVSGLSTQYGVDTSDSSASAVACSPASANVSVGKPAVFSLSGLPKDAAYFWATHQGRSEEGKDGSFSVTFATPGVHEASAFWLDGSRWRRVTCSVTVR